MSTLFRPFHQSRKYLFSKNVDAKCDEKIIKMYLEEKEFMKNNEGKTPDQINDITHCEIPQTFRNEFLRESLLRNIRLINRN